MTIDTLIDAASAGRLDDVRHMLASDSTLATATGGPRACQPIVYLGFADPTIRELPEIARLLIDHGADPNATYREEGSPDDPLAALYPAVGYRNNPALARVLLESGANPNDGESIYHAAEHNHRECLDLLLRYGGDPSARHPHWNNTPLYFLAGYREQANGAERALEGMRWLLEHGADPNVTSAPHEERPLHRIAANWSRRHVVDLFISHGADPSAKRSDGMTPLRIAIRAGHTAVADALRQHGAAFDATPMDCFLGACLRGDRAGVETCLADDPTLVAQLSDEDRATLVEAAGRGRTEAVRLMLELGFPIDARGEAGATALHHAAWNGHVDTVRALLEHDPPLDVRCTAYAGTPLDWAAHGSLFCRNPKGDYPEIARLLLAAGATPCAEPWGSEEVMAVMRGE